MARKKTQRIRKPDKTLEDTVTFLDTKGRKKTLTLQQEKFCQIFASETEMFGNGVRSYIEAYDIDLSKKGAYDSAKANAYKLLTKAYINERIDQLLEDIGMNNQHADKQLYFVMTQKGDLRSKVAAIQHYNKLKKRVSDALDITSKGEKIKSAIIAQLPAEEESALDDDYDQIDEAKSLAANGEGGTVGE